MSTRFTCAPRVKCKIDIFVRFIGKFKKQIEVRAISAGFSYFFNKKLAGAMVLFLVLTGHTHTQNLGK